MSKKRTLPTQANTLLSFFSKGSPSNSTASSSKLPPKKKVKKTEGSSVHDPVCLLDSSSDEEDVVLLSTADRKGKGKEIAKQDIIDLPDSSQEERGSRRKKGKQAKEEEENQLQVDEDDPLLDGHGILAEEEFDALMDSIGMEEFEGVSRTSCQRWEHEHRHPFPSSGLKPPPPPPQLPSALRTSPSSLAGPSNPTKGRVSNSVDLPVVIDLDEEDDSGFGDFDDGGWNPEDDEQGEQDDPGEEDLEDGLGEREEDEFFDEGFRGYADEVMIADEEDDEEEQVRSSSPLSLCPILQPS